MAWLASTSFRDLKPGTVFSIVESPQDSEFAGVLAPGDQFEIVRHDMTRIPAEVLEASSTEIVIEVNGARCLMTPWRSGDIESPHITSMRQEVWVARQVDLIE